MAKRSRFCWDECYVSEWVESRPTPEKRLLTAVLGRALNDLHSWRPEVVRDACLWFSERGPRSLGFSFNDIMDQLCFTAEQTKLILAYVNRELYGKCETEGEAGGVSAGELVKGEGVPFCEEECPALRFAYGVLNRSC